MVRPGKSQKKHGYESCIQDLCFYQYLEADGVIVDYDCFLYYIHSVIYRHPVVAYMTLYNLSS